MKIIWGKPLTSLWEKIFPPKPPTKEEQMRRERLASIEVKVDWLTGRVTSRIKDLDRYFRNCPNLERDLKALRSIPLGVPLDDNLEPIDRKKK